jgi:hypothetical protein
MMVVVDAYVDVLSHLRLLRNRIVPVYQNFQSINIEKMKRHNSRSFDGSQRESIALPLFLI